MNQLALPYYPARSLENQRIRNRVTRTSNKYGIERTFEKGIHNLMRYCPKCKQFKLLEDFVRNSKAKTAKKSQYCISCRIIYNRKYNTLEANKKYWNSKKIRAYRMIQYECKCIRCGCNDIRFLEINHKNGGGSKEGRKARMYQDILSGRRNTNDLELLCRPCNHIHYLEMKYGEKIGLKVIWDKTNLDIEENELGDPDFEPESDPDEEFY